MKNITHILHFPAFEFYIPDRIMQTVQQERGMDMKQIFVSSTLLWNAGLEEMFQRVYDNGFDGIELWAQQFFACLLYTSLPSISRRRQWRVR